jgi:hypothetical protein
VNLVVADVDSWREFLGTVGVLMDQSLPQAAITPVRDRLTPLPTDRVSSTTPV